MFCFRTSMGLWGNCAAGAAVASASIEAHNPVIFHIVLILLGGPSSDSVPDMPLEVEFQCKLQNPWVHDGGQDLSEGRRRKICVWVSELRSIESIEKLRSKLEIAPLSWPPHRGTLD